MGKAGANKRANDAHIFFIYLYLNCLSFYCYFTLETLQGLGADHSNKAGIAIKESLEFFGFLVHKSYVYTIL